MEGLFCNFRHLALMHVAPANSVQVIPLQFQRYLGDKYLLSVSMSASRGAGRLLCGCWG